jgi:hypothetical protein
MIWQTKLSNILFLAMIIHALNVIFPAPGKAITRWNGMLSLEDTNVSTPANNSNLFQGRLNLDIKPATKKRLDARINLQANFTQADGKKSWDFSPIGNLGVNLSGESYNFNVKHSNYSTLSSTAELVQTQLSRAALAITPRDMPRFFTDYSTTETSSAGTDARSDTFSLSSDYIYRWMNFRGGYSRRERFITGQKISMSDSYFFGTGVTYEILPRTTVTGGFDFNRSSSDNLSGYRSTTKGRIFRLGANSRPLDWFGLSGNFNNDTTDSESGTFAGTSTERRNMDLTARLYPFQGLEISTTLGNRKFNDAGGDRSVDFRTVAASFTDKLHEKIQVGLNVSRSEESDPDQGENLRDNFGFNSTLDLTPRISARTNLNISRSEIPGFVSTSTYNASGTLAERDTLDADATGLPAGFTFFDTANNDLYTKNSAAIGDWSEPVHIDPVTEQFSVSKTLQLNMIPSDKTSFILSYTSNSSADRLDLAESDSQSLSGAFGYRPNLRTSYSLSGTASLPRTGSAGYAGTLGMAYRFFRGHQMNLSYSSRFSPDKTTSSFSGSLRLSLRKRTSLEFTYSASQLFAEDETHFIRGRFSKAF